METKTNYIDQLTDKVKENFPVANQVENVIRDNEQFFTAAGGAFLTVLGLKFFSKTFGFLAFVGGAAILYRSANANPAIREVLNKIAVPQAAAPQKAPQITPPILEEVSAS